MINVEFVFSDSSKSHDAVPFPPPSLLFPLAPMAGPMPGIASKPERQRPQVATTITITKTWMNGGWRRI
jgi:hypothetical protein